VNWDAIGAIAETLGAIGVIATLVYLSTQIRTNNIAIRTSTYLELVNANHIRFATGTDPVLAELFDRGMQDPESLKDIELFQFRQLILHQSRQFENIHYQYESRLIEEHLWEAWARSMKSFYSRPGAHQVWEKNAGDIFNKHFVAFIDEVIEEIPPNSVVAE
jgi:hypothetical protein